MAKAVKQRKLESTFTLTGRHGDRSCDGAGRNMSLPSHILGRCQYSAGFLLSLTSIQSKKMMPYTIKVGLLRTVIPYGNTSIDVLKVFNLEVY